jgi:hypothetical protein
MYIGSNLRIWLGRKGFLRCGKAMRALYVAAAGRLEAILAVVAIGSLVVGQALPGAKQIDKAVF